MNIGTPVIVATIAGVATIVGSYFTTAATIDKRISEVDTTVRVVEERQENQYKELKEGINRIEQKIDRAIQSNTF